MNDDSYPPARRALPVHFRKPDAFIIEIGCAGAPGKCTMQHIGLERETLWVRRVAIELSRLERLAKSVQEDCERLLHALVLKRGE